MWSGLINNGFTCRGKADHYCGGKCGFYCGGKIEAFSARVRLAFIVRGMRVGCYVGITVFIVWDGVVVIVRG